MKTLTLTRDWDSPRGLLPAGSYSIPADISLTLAKCARADGSGEIVEGASVAEAPAGDGRARRKRGASENKRRDEAPENKSEV
jgi:hypothetical protein